MERQATSEERQAMLAFGKCRDMRERLEKMEAQLRANLTAMLITGEQLEKMEAQLRANLTAMLITGEILSCPEGKCRLQDDGSMVFGWTKPMNANKVGHDTGSE